MQVNLTSTLERCCCRDYMCIYRRPLHHIDVRLNLAPRLTLDLRSAGGGHVAEIIVSFRDPATGAAITAAEWAARFGALVLPAPRTVELPTTSWRAYQNNLVQEYEDHFGGLRIQIVTQGRRHAAFAELRRWEEGVSWAAPQRWPACPRFRRALHLHWPHY
jgi:hypothetical protein